MRFYTVTKTQWDEEDYVLFFEQNQSINPTNCEDLIVSGDKKEVEDFFNSLHCCEDEMYTEYTMYESDDFDEGDEDVQVIIDAMDSKDYMDLPQSLYQYEIERKEFDVELTKIAPKAVIVKWCWKTYVGYCRECIEIDFAKNFGIEDERGLCTGNSDKVFRPNFSILVDDAEIYEGGEDLYDAVAEQLEDSSRWKWQNDAFRKLDNFIDFEC